MAKKRVYTKEQLERKKAKYKEWYQKNKEKRSEYIKKWREENKEHDKQRQYNYNHTPMGRASRLVQKYNYNDEIAGRGKGDLTKEWLYDNIIFKPCVYCGKTGWNVIGCNRLDNSKPHTMDNVEPCCEECNKKLYFKEMKIKVYQYTLDNELVGIWSSAGEAAEELGISRRHICSCCNGKRKTHNGFKWSYNLL